MAIETYGFNLDCDMSKAWAYTSQSQIARVLSESWVLDNMYCLDCDARNLQNTKANTHCLDFTCIKCLHRYELKTFSRRPGKALVDGAYKSMMESIRSGSKPTLFLLQRDPNWRVQTFTAVHSAFLNESLIEARKPLSANAKRAGWIGCNIRLDRLPPEGELTVVADESVNDPNSVRKAFRALTPFKQLSLQERGWTSLTLSVARRLRSDVFSLQAIYEFEEMFREAYPANENIRAKIRQQLQVLRDLGIVEFLGAGHYRFLKAGF